MRLNLERRLLGLEKNLLSKPTLVETAQILALRRVSDEDLNLIVAVTSRCPPKAETVEEAAAMRRFEVHLGEVSAGG